jgi:hypothetical protein
VRTDVRYRLRFSPSSYGSGGQGQREPRGTLSSRKEASGTESAAVGSLKLRFAFRDNSTPKTRAGLSLCGTRPHRSNICRAVLVTGFHSRSPGRDFKLQSTFQVSTRIAPAYPTQNLIPPLSHRRGPKCPHQGLSVSKGRKTIQ